MTARLTVSIRVRSRKLSAAERLAKYMLTGKGVTAVYLFGSLAERGTGNDIDLVIEAEGEPFEEYWRAVSEDVYPTERASRLAQIARFLGLQWAELAAARRSEDLPKDVDVLLLPPEWRERAGDLAHTLPLHREPGFLPKVAQQARRFNPTTGKFDERESATPQPA